VFEGLFKMFEGKNLLAEGGSSSLIMISESWQYKTES
jgi:hypothetical protein